MSNLVLGWQVTSGLEPRYWLSRSAKPGSQANTELVSVPTDTLGTHTAIIGQSGSGKSSFLGRIIEELLLQTKAKCVILDQNSDFGQIHKINEDIWKKCRYDPLLGRGKLPHEASCEEFKSQWLEVSTCISSANTAKVRLKDDDIDDRHPYVLLRLWWPSFSAEILAEEDNPTVRSELYHCHAFVKAISYLAILKYHAENTDKRTMPYPDTMRKAEKYYNIWRTDISSQLSPTKLNSALSQAITLAYDSAQLLPGVSSLDEYTSATLGLRRVKGTSKKAKSRRLIIRFINQRTINSWIDRAKTALDYVSEEVGRYYFGKYLEYRALGVLTNKPKPDIRYGDRLLVLDLPSLPDKKTRLLAINSLLENEWEQAKSNWQKALDTLANKDDRVPVFIVLDEAHNFLSIDPKSKAEVALREQFRTIAAEGRKYGIFLIVASQRPDKLDSIVLSECENIAIMKLDSAHLLELTSEVLGLENIPPRIRERCLEFGLGRVLITGRWTHGTPILLYGAARRTIEGGRNLRPEYWAEPYLKDT